MKSISSSTLDDDLSSSEFEEELDRLMQFILTFISSPVCDRGIVGMLRLKKEGCTNSLVSWCSDVQCERYYWPSEFLWIETLENGFRSTWILTVARHGTGHTSKYRRLTQCGPQLKCALICSQMRSSWAADRQHWKYSTAGKVRAPWLGRQLGCSKLRIGAQSYMKEGNWRSPRKFRVKMKSRDLSFILGHTSK